MPQESSTSKLRPISPRALTVAVVCMAVEWIMLVAGLKPHEMIVGACSVAVAAVFVWRALQLSERLDIRARDVLTAWRIPGIMLGDAWTVTVVLLKDLFGGQPAPSAYRATAFRTAADDPLMVARRVLATAYTTSTPNSIVIGIDPQQSLMLVHQLKLSPPSALERELGGQG